MIRIAKTPLSKIVRSTDDVWTFDLRFAYPDTPLTLMSSYEIHVSFFIIHLLLKLLMGATPYDVDPEVLGLLSGYDGKAVDRLSNFNTK